MKVGGLIYIDDGLLSLEVEQIAEGNVTCRVVNCKTKNRGACRYSFVFVSHALITSSRYPWQSQRRQPAQCEC